MRPHRLRWVFSAINSAIKSVWPRREVRQEVKTFVVGFRAVLHASHIVHNYQIRRQRLLGSKGLTKRPLRTRWLIAPETAKPASKRMREEEQHRGSAFRLSTTGFHPLFYCSQDDARCTTLQIF